MAVWYTIPSVRPPDEAMAALSRWVSRGYKVAVQRDEDATSLPVDLCWHGPYKGYANAVNKLVMMVLERDPECEWVVTGGDDVLPDPDHDPAVIAAELMEHFGGTLGVMQPTGDRYMEDDSGRCAAERVCISPWMGREFCERSYGGDGPLWHEYFHEFVDEELHGVARMLGVLWHRPDLNQYHAWWGREGKEQPEHLKHLAARWDGAKALFERREAAGFPGSELLP